MVNVYGSAPVNTTEPLSPFQPVLGHQLAPPGLATPPFTAKTGGPEPVEQLIARARARSEIVRAEILKLQEELRKLDQIIALDGSSL